MGNGRILIVDDEPAICESLARWLERDGHDVEKVLSGAEALERLNASRFDILLVDVKMEGISGLDVLSAVKANYPDVAVVMITAYVCVPTAIEAMKGKACDYLLKPFDPKDLSLLIEKILQDRARDKKHCFPDGSDTAASTLPAGAKATGKHKQNMKMMLVDDEERFLFGITKLLAKKGYDVITKTSGAEAIETLKRKTVHVVVLDVRMPGMDGIETLIEIKRLFPMIEVIMLTGHATVESAVDGLKFGASDFLMKPIDIDELLQKAEEAFEKRQRLEEKIRMAYTRK
ncbi:MAG: response regulator [Proteobacteria bacterium]|nr:response regulator [Pseudomonadota bacterium]